MIDPRTLLKNVWIGFSTVSAIISLASLFDSLVAWVAFIGDVIASYRSIAAAVWGPILAIIPYRLPRWTHDYMTLSAITGVSVVWALHNTARELGFTRLGSVFGVLKNAFLDFKVGGNSLGLFEVEAIDLLRQRDGDVDIASERAIRRIARPERGWFLIMDGVLSSLVLIVLAVLAPFVIPAYMDYRDRLSLRRGAAMFRRRRTEIDSIPVPPETQDLLRAMLDRKSEDHAMFAGINALFYQTVRKNITIYYLAVTVAFLVVVLLNHLARQAGFE